MSAGKSSSDVLLSVKDLSVAFPTARGRLHALDGISLDVHSGRTLGIVGESGSGKSVLSRAILGLLPRKASIADEARILFEGQDLLKLPGEQLQEIRGRRIAMIFQDPMTALNPVRSIGSQLVEGMRRHFRLPAGQAAERAHALLDSVGINSPRVRFNQYPHELSGGMRQRVVIAMAIACEPDLLIADEPTTALDVTVQAEILDLLRDLQQSRQMAVILVTHDLGVAAGFADEIAVMYAGQLVERAATRDVFKRAVMPYTRALLAAIPSISDRAHAPLASIAGRPPAMYGASSGCRFATRCTKTDTACTATAPPLAKLEAPSQHLYRCWKPEVWA